MNHIVIDLLYILMVVQIRVVVRPFEGRSVHSRTMHIHALSIHPSIHPETLETVQYVERRRQAIKKLCLYAARLGTIGRLTKSICLSVCLSVCVCARV